MITKMYLNYRKTRSNLKTFQLLKCRIFKISFSFLPMNPYFLLQLSFIKNCLCMYNNEREINQHKKLFHKHTRKYMKKSTHVYLQPFLHFLSCCVGYYRVVQGFNLRHES